MKRDNTWSKSEQERRNEEVRRAVAEHMEKCSDCREETDFLKVLAAESRKLNLSAPGGLKETIMVMIADRYDVIDTDFGTAHVAFTPKGISAVKLDVDEDGAFESYYEDRLGRTVVRGSLSETHAQAVRRAMVGEKTGPPPVTLEGLTGFEQTVLEHLAKIPAGEVRPYAWLAREVGRPKAIRAVGTVMARNPVPFLMPLPPARTLDRRRGKLLLWTGNEMDAAGTGGDCQGGSRELETARRALHRQPNDRYLLLSYLPRRPAHPAATPT